MSKSNVWTNAQENFLKKKIDTQQHPSDFVDDFNKKFDTSRSVQGLERKAQRLNLSLAACVKKGSIPTKAESIIVVKKDIEIERLRSLLTISNSKYKEAIKNSSTTEVVIAYLQKYLKALPKVTPPKPNLTIDKTKSEEELVLCLSDIHAGETVKAEELNGLNEYNFDIMVRRLKLLVDSVIDIAKNKLRGYTFRRLHILGLGDWISGTIHQELLEYAEGNVMEWTMNLAYVVAQMLRELATVFEEIEFIGIVGNHGRLHRKPRFKARYINWDFICYQMLSGLLSNQPNIKFNIPRSFWAIHKINNFNFLLIHGDNINSYLGMPWYGINRTVANLKERLESQGQHFHYMVLGHLYIFVLYKEPEHLYILLLCMEPEHPCKHFQYMQLALYSFLAHLYIFQ